MPDFILSSFLKRFIDEEGLKSIQRFVQPLEMSTGDIIREGSVPGMVFFLSHGAVDILLESVGEAVKTLEAPQVVGEMAYLTGANAGATVRVKRPVSGVSIRTGQFHQLLKEEPRVGALLMSFLARTLAHRLAAANRHVRRLECDVHRDDLDLRSLEAAQIDEAFSAEFAAVDLEDVWEASFEL